MQALQRPIRCKLNDFSIFNNLYIDDNLIKSQSQQLCKFQALFYFFMVQCAGWSLAPDKTMTSPVKKCKYLGFLIDSSSMYISAEQIKCSYVISQITEVNLLSEALTPIPAQHIAHVAGLLVHLTVSHGELLRVAARTMQHELGVCVAKNGWKGNLILSKQAIAELQLIKEILKRFNGRKMNMKLHRIEIEFPVKDIIFVKDLPDCHISDVLVSDSSESHSFIFNCNATLTMLEEFTTDIKALSSTYREIMAFVNLIRNKPESFQQYRNSIVVWITDSRCTFFTMSRGSRNFAIQKLIIELLQFQLEHNFLIKVTWKSRDSNILQIADQGSKFLTQSTEYGVDHATFQEMCRVFQVTPTVDGFASHLNRRCEIFFSVIPLPETSGVDFFAQKLSTDHIYYLDPPVKLLIKVIYTVLDAGVTAILSLPVWRTRSFWSVITDFKYFKPFVGKAFFYKPFFVNFGKNKNFFRSYMPFPHLFILISKDFKEKIMIPHMGKY